ncbi:hypothetical protein QL285_066402 [Trifolium repens]|nr:hypothetical protein QL285_066402 [Trifolium repens]
MKVIFLATLLLIISGAQAISNEDEDFNMNFTSKQAHELLGNLYGNGNMEVSTRLNHKGVIMESNNEHKHKLSVTIRKGFGLGTAAGGAAAGVGTGVVVATHEYSNSSATSLYAGPYFYVSTFILCVNLLL